MIEGLFQPMHLLLILAIATLFFGPQKLPQLGRSLGEGIKGFKEAIKNVENGTSGEKSEPPNSPPSETEKK